MKNTLFAYSYLTTPCLGFSEAIDHLIDQLDPAARIVRLTFFGKTASDESYIEEQEAIDMRVGSLNWRCVPLVSYIAQSPLCGSVLAVEVQQLVAKDVSSIERYAYSSSTCALRVIAGVNQMLLVHLDSRNELGSINNCAHSCFEQLSTLLDVFHISPRAIVRQWNYIERITAVDGGCQHYQIFNDIRTDFFENKGWYADFPAATGIGTDRGGVVIDADLYQGESVRTGAMDNDLQVAAHAYSQQVLVGQASVADQGRTTPKFERARQLVFSPHEGLIYVSGTAAIRGEASLLDCDAQAQTRMTLENIDHLLRPSNLPLGSSSVLPRLEAIRVYLKTASDYEAVRTEVQRRYPKLTNSLYVEARVCRDELLVEIEGIASF